MANPAQGGHLIGRVGKNGIKQFPNRDGSVTLKFSLAVEDDFVRTGKTEPDTQFFPVEAFIPAKANGIGSWKNVHEGDLIAVMVSFQYRPYQKDGQTVYPDGVTLRVDGYPRYMESKAITEARAAAKAAEAQAAAPAAAPVATGTVTVDAARLAELEARAAAAGDPVNSPFGA